MLVYKHTETMEYLKKLAYFLRKIQISRADNSRIPWINNAKSYCFYMNSKYSEILKSALVYL